MATETPEACYLMISFDADILINSGRIFAHEGGHVIIATVKDIKYGGIGYNKDVPGFSTLARLPCPPDVFSLNHYLFLAAGVAAERTYCERNDEAEGGDDDKEYFNQPNAPDFETTVEAAREILSIRKTTIGYIVSILKTKLKEINCDFDRLPEINIKGAQYALVLTETEVKDTVANH